LSFDPVHDSQAVYRALVRAFSFPGTTVSIEGPASRAVTTGLPAPLEAVALTLLDAETTWFGTGLGGLSELTGATSRPVGEAAFVVLTTWSDDAWSDAFRRASCGTLADPQLGATVLVWSGTGVGLQTWKASGPGLEGPRNIEVPEGSWVTARNEACREFPLGVDLIWCHGTGVTALPRSTALSPAGGA